MPCSLFCISSPSCACASPRVVGGPSNHLQLPAIPASPEQQPASASGSLKFTNVAKDSTCIGVEPCVAGSLSSVAIFSCCKAEWLGSLGGRWKPALTVLIITIEAGIRLLLNKGRRHIKSLSIGTLAGNKENDRRRSNASSTNNIWRTP